jgi:ribonuclease E
VLDDEPTGDSTPPAGAPQTDTPAPAKKAVRRRATSKTAADAPDDAPDDAGAVPDSEPAAPAKKAPAKRTAKKAAPRKKAAATIDEPGADAAPDESPAIQSPAADAPAEDAPAKRTRKRASAIVPFMAPELGSDDDEPVAPRPRRRAGTAGAVSPSALMPELSGPDAGPDADADEDDDDPDRPRRRRRRGGRGRGSRPEGADDTSVDEPIAEGEDTSDDDKFETAADGTRRRRRRRRRSGSGGADTTPDENDPPGTVVHVREPRQRSVRGAGAAGEDGVRGISGSTRMAAKRVRRQEGRDSGRGRAPILTEAEFLARREAVDRVMVVRQKADRTQIAVLEDGILVEHYVTKATAQSYAGNVYLGKVQNVLPSMEAAFVDIGKGRNAVLYAGEVNYDLMGAGGGARKIESVLKSGQDVLVQVSKDPLGHKGARLTSQISLPGRYLVYVPEGNMTGISRKLPENERTRLKAILKKVVPEDAGVIIRTAAEGASEEELAADVRRLQAQWEVIKTKGSQGGAPKLLHAEPDLLIRVVRDIFNEDFASLVVSGENEWDTIRDYVEFVAPDLAPRLKKYDGADDVFAAYRIDEQLAKALDRKVWLPSGGSLVIDRTEAMVVVDVNTGKYVGKGGNLEETVTRNNLEAAEEIARQLRLRDLGGIIVVDFIDMVLESNRDLVVRRLVECLGRDRTKHQVAEVTSLGLVQMTRKRVGQGLLESFSEPCEVCNGRGVIVHSEPVDEKKQARVERFDDRPRSERGGRDRGGRAADDRPREDKREDKPAADADDGDSAAPRKRSRGGRGRGGRAEGAAVEGAAVEGAAVESELPAVDSLPADDQVPFAEAPPEIAEQPPTVLEDQPPTVLEDQPVLPEPTPAANGAEPAAEPAAEPGPKRRRRATSRPAGPPTVSA